MRFTKAQALGNDFIIVEDLAENLKLTTEQIRFLCQRRLGIGADGILLLRPSQKADYKMHIFNADGSEAEMCGNGIRCLGCYIHENGLSTKKTLLIETLVGNKKLKLNFDGKKLKSVTVDLGKPIFERSRIPMCGKKKEAINESIKVGERELKATCLSMGNPHCVIFVQNVKAVPVERLGPALEHLPLFPQRTNVEFVEVISPEKLSIRVWERGVGETMACGTGAAASLAAAAKNGYAQRRAKVILKGGYLEVEWAENNLVYITGEAEITYTGEIDLNRFEGKNAGN